MNCYDFMAADTVDIKITIASDVVNGDVTPIRITGTKRQTQCGVGIYPVPDNPGFKYRATMRQDAFCNRFKIDWPYELWNTQQLDQPVTYLGFGAYSSSNRYPRPWDSADPFYKRAADVWEATEAKDDGKDKGAYGFFIVFGEQYFWHFNRYEDGASATIYDGYGTGHGSATLTLRKK